MILPCSKLVLHCLMEMVLYLTVQVCFTVDVSVVLVYYISVSACIHTHTIFLAFSSTYHPINCFKCYILRNESGQQGQYAGKLFCSERKVLQCTSSVL